MRQLFAMMLICAAVAACKPQATTTATSTSAATAQATGSAKPDAVASVQNGKSAAAEPKASESDNPPGATTKNSGGKADAINLPRDQWPVEVRNDPRVLGCMSAGGTTVECRTQDYEIDVIAGNCSATDGIYGQTSSAKGKRQVQLYRDPEPESPKGPALEDGVFVCKTAVANIHGFNQAVWHYVRAIPVSAVPKCKGNDLCKGAQGLPTSCKPNAQGIFSQSCPGGWIEDENYGEYSMGI